MTANLRIIADNLTDSATLTASPAVVTTLPVTNLQLSPRAKIVRTTSTADQQIKGTWSSAQMLSGCALWRHNLTNTGTWRLELFLNADWTSLVYDSGDVIACPPKALNDLLWGVEPLGIDVFTGWALRYSNLWFAGVIARSFRITLKDAGNADGYLEAARLFIGNYLEPVYNFAYGHEPDWVDASTQSRTDGGSLRTDAVAPYRRLALRLESMTDSDRPKFFDMGRAQGKRYEMFISAHPATGGAKERDYAFACKLVKSTKPRSVSFGRYSMDIEVEES